MALSNPNSNRVKVTGRDFNELRALIRSKPDQVTTQVANGLQDIGAQAVRDMRTTIETSVTKTGSRQLARGRRSTAGRIRGNDEVTQSRPRVGGRSMINSVDQEVKVNRRSVSLRFGWITGRPGYAFFQEYGTSNGVPAMHALTDAKVNANIKVQLLLRSIK